MREKIIRIFVMLFVIVGVVLIIGMTWKFIDEFDEFDSKLDVKFCNDQGWGYTSGFNEDLNTVWCGALDYSNGFTGITYPYYKTWYGKYKVSEDFDVNEEIKKMNALDMESKK